MKKIILVLFSFLLVGCEIGATGLTGPQITIAKAYSIALTVDTNGEVHLTGQVTIPTPYKYKIVDLDWIAAFDITLNKAQESENTLYLLYDDGNGSIIQDTYAIDHPFEITFARDEWVRKINHDGKGNTVVFVDIQNSIPPSTTTLKKRYDQYGFELIWAGGESNGRDDTKLLKSKISSITVENQSSAKLYYDWHNGVLSGTLNGYTMSGTWTQDNGHGNFELTFSPDFSSATGWWNSKNSPGKHDFIIQ